MQFSAILLLHTTKTKPKSQLSLLRYIRHISQCLVLPFCGSSFSISSLFLSSSLSLSLSLWLLFAETGSVAIHQVRTVRGASKKAWRGTGETIHLFTHSLTHSLSHSLTHSLISLLRITITFTSVSLVG